MCSFVIKVTVQVGNHCCLRGMYQCVGNSHLKGKTVSISSKFNPILSKNESDEH